MPVTEIYAFLGDDDNGKEGFVMVQLKRPDQDPMMVQLVAASLEEAEQYKVWAEAVAKGTGKKIRLVRFSVSEELAVIG